MPSPEELQAASALAWTNSPQTPTPIPLPITGRLPPWLSGVLYRTGPGTYSIPSPKARGGTVEVQHWFDGLGMNHRFALSGSSQTVFYSARSSAPAVEAEIAQAGKVVGISFGQTDPCETIFQKFFTTFRRLTGAEEGDVQAHSQPGGQNIQVTLSPDLPGFPAKKIPQHLKDRQSGKGEGPRYLVAKTDASLLQLLDPTTLEPLAVATYRSFSPELEGMFSAAHGCTDPATGTYYNFVASVGSKTVYKVFSITKPGGEVKVLAEIKDAPLAYIHSLTMTGRYVVLCVWASEISYSGLSILYNSNIAQSISPSLARPSAWYVIDRLAGGLVAKYTTPAFFAFHHLNAFDDPATGDVIVDLAVYKDSSFIQDLYVEKLKSGLPKALQGQARRYRLPDPSKILPSEAGNPREGKVDWTADAWLELPTVRPEVYHRPYRWVYGMSKTGDSARFADAVVKVDVAANPPTTKYWYAEDGQTPGEPIFVSRPGGTEEDDGVVLVVVLDGLRKRSFLLVLDGRTLEEVARAESPEGIWVGAGFHGAFV